jgi:GR25 family glycosyltransferase involved in LPS biosynthesis
MDKHISRRDYITNQLDKVSHTYHRVKGFNGNLITTPSAGNIEDVSFVNSYDRLTKSEVGCCISHILAIKQAYESGTVVAMICEDDIYLGTYSLIPRLSDIVSDAPKDWKILQLYSMDFSNDKKYSNFVKNNDGKYIYVKREYPKKAFASTLAYLINRKGMSDILQKVYRNTSTIHLKPVSIKNNKVYPPRGEADFFIYDLVESYATLPSLFFPDNTVLESTIRLENDFSKSAAAARSFNSLLSKQIS